MRTIIFSKTMFLSNSEGRVCIFAANQPYAVNDFRSDYKSNWIHFSFENDLFEFVPMNDVKIK